jgi:glycerate kinase
MKVIIAPDKFKGSLTSIEVCTAIVEGLLNADKSLEIFFFPMADGGDGFADAMKYYTDTLTEQVESVDSLGRPITSVYEWNVRESTALIELASCSGLAMLHKDERNPLITSTYGTGLQIQHAIKRGAKKIILGIGGSATNDAGIGILGAMGFMFLDGKGNPAKPAGQALKQITKIIPPDSLPVIQFEIACDVNNPLYGPEGAAIIFSGQKGATPQQAKSLDDGLKHFAGIILQQTGKDVSKFPGAGAAGGIAAGLMAYLPVNIIEGTQLILKASNIESRIENADIVITGEGKIDLQSFRGKTICAITSMARRNNIPVIALCGKLELSKPEWEELGLMLAAEINNVYITEEESMHRAYELLTKKAESIAPLIKELISKNEKNENRDS